MPRYLPRIDGRIGTNLSHILVGLKYVLCDASGYA
jgi:hypothetical protein